MHLLRIFKIKSLKMRIWHIATNESPVLDREKLKQMQRDDESLQKYWDKDDVVVRGQAENLFGVKCGVLYRVYKHPYVNGGNPLKQGMVPVQREDAINWQAV